jgi:hypothetical protein
MILMSVVLTTLIFRPYPKCGIYIRRVWPAVVAGACLRGKVFRPPHEAELLSESKELNVNFQDLESFLADPDPHDLMAICPRHPNGHFGACIRLVYVPPVYVSGFR